MHYGLPAYLLLVNLVQFEFFLKASMCTPSCVPVTPPKRKVR